MESLGEGTGSDLIPVWRAARAFLHGGEPYQPGLVYPPSALLLAAPLGALSFNHAHLIFHAVNIAAIGAATVLAFKVFRLDHTSAAAPAIAFALVISAPVRLTLYTANVNGVVVAAEMSALYAATRDQWTISGLAFGLGLAVKPVLLPLVLVFALARQWRAAASAVAVSVLLSGLAVPLMRGAPSFALHVIPFLWRGNDPRNYMINTSVAGAAGILGLPRWLATVARVATVGAGAVIIWRRLRESGDSTIVAADLIGIVLATTFLGFSFSWPYYAIYLLPTFLSLASPRRASSWWRPALFGAAAYLIASQDYLRTYGAVRITLGYYVLLVALAPMRRLGRQPSGRVGAEASIRLSS